jgi:hypothetical protein
MTKEPEGSHLIVEEGDKTFQVRYDRRPGKKVRTG